LQSDEPQFLCIEEPENGLNPKVVRELVHFCRNACEEKGHYIWLNTHSQTLLSELNEEELIIVDKKKGETQIKQFKKGDFYSLRADEALLSNVLGGGIPW
jgi:predicted ATPase